MLPNIIDTRLYTSFIGEVTLLGLRLYVVSIPVHPPSHLMAGIHTVNDTVQRHYRSSVHRASHYSPAFDYTTSVLLDLCFGIRATPHITSLYGALPSLDQQSTIYNLQLTTQLRPCIPLCNIDVVGTPPLINGSIHYHFSEMTTR
jgi:hypothetical protein